MFDQWINKWINELERTMDERANEHNTAEHIIMIPQ